MSQQEIIEEIKRLSVKDRICIIEAISSSVRQDLDAPQHAAPTSGEMSGHVDAQNSERDKASISQRLYGILKFNGDPPTDEEVKDAYADYLSEKYS